MHEYKQVEEGNHSNICIRGLQDDLEDLSENFVAEGVESGDLSRGLVTHNQRGNCHNNLKIDLKAPPDWQSRVCKMGKRLEGSRRLGYL